MTFALIYGKAEVRGLVVSNGGFFNGVDLRYRFGVAEMEEGDRERFGEFM